MKKMLILAILLTAGGGAAQAQDCSGVAPVIQRIDTATVDRPSPTTAVIQLDVVALSANGYGLTYSFSGDAGAIASDGPHATWNVEGDGPFTADIEVHGSSEQCIARASVTYTPEAAQSGGGGSDDDSGE